MIHTTIAQAIIETVSFITAGVAFPGSYWFNVIVNDLLFINNALFSLLWVLYVGWKLFGDIRHLKAHWYVGIPALLIIIASIINLFVPVFFTVDRVTFDYSRTDLYFIPFCIALFYLVYGFILTYKYKSKSLFFPALIFLIPIIIAAVTEFFFYGLNVLWIGVAIALTSVYINLQNQVSYTDSLSGLLSRQYLTIYLQNEIKKPSEMKLMGIMMDIDSFKAINDTYGHLAGDDAISSAGAILHQAMTHDDAAFRFGGDEFMVIQSGRDESEVFDTIARINSLTEKFNAASDSYKINFSFGTAVYDRSGDTMDGFLGRMDSAMYADKKKNKECVIEAQNPPLGKTERKSFLHFY